MIRNFRKPLRQCRKGFSFTEILFAVMILGIGFIMVAAVFPVAIKQTRETVDETTAADIAQAAASYLGRIGTNSNFPVTYSMTSGQDPRYPNDPSRRSPSVEFPVGNNPKTYNYNGNVVRVNAPYAINSFWTSVGGNLIYPTDPRYAWIPFYSRGADVNGVALPYAQVTVICVQCQNSPSFTPYDVNLTPTAPMPFPPTMQNLQGRGALAAFTLGTTFATPDTIVISPNPDKSDAGNVPSPAAFVAQGTYVIIANDTSSQIDPTKSCNGFILRIGNPVAGDTSGTKWELMPGSDLKNLRYPPTGGSIQVFLVGRGYNSSSNGDTAIAGPAMDIAAYSTFIQVRPDPSVASN